MHTRENQWILRSRLKFFCLVRRATKNSDKYHSGHSILPNGENTHVRNRIPNLMCYSKLLLHDDDVVLVYLTCRPNQRNRYWNTKSIYISHMSYTYIINHSFHTILGLNWHYMIKENRKLYGVFDLIAKIVQKRASVLVVEDGELIYQSPVRILDTFVTDNHEILWGIHSPALAILYPL